MKKRAWLASTLLLASSGWASAFPFEPPAVAPEKAPPPAQKTAAPAEQPVLLSDDGNPVFAGVEDDSSWSWGGKYWFRADYLMFWVKPGPNDVPLLTTGPDFVDTPGVIGLPSTRILMGRGSLNYGTFSGMQFTAGAWLNGGQTWGLELRAFVLEQLAEPDFDRSDADGNPFLLRPFFNVQDNTEDVAIVAFPGLIRGQLHYTNETQFWGSEINLFHNWVQGGSGRIDAIYGFRYLQLNERLRIDENYFPLDEDGNEISFAGQGFEFPNAVYVFDQFRTRNQFYGAQFGARAELNFGSVFVDARAQIALGTTHSKVMISGGSYLYNNETGEEVASANGGILALPSNIGNRTTNSFAVAPSIELKVGYLVTQNLRVHVGYNFIYLSQVLRPGQQIDRFVDPRQVPTFDQFDADFVAQRPRQPLAGSDFWAQGLEFGFELRY